MTTYISSEAQKNMNEQTEKAICRVVVKCHKKYIYLLTFTLMVHILYYPYPEKYNVNVLG